MGLRVRAEILENAPEDLLSLAPSPEGVLYWSGPDAEIVGWGEALRLSFSGPDAMSEAAAQWGEVVTGSVVAGSVVAGSAGAGPQRFPLALASFGFSAHTPGYLVVPRVALLRQGGVTTLVTASAGPEEPAEALPEVREPVSRPEGLETSAGRMTQGEWKAAVNRLVALLRSGAASKVVLTRDLIVSAAAPIDERYLISRLRELYPTTWVYAVEGLVGATPELLASMEGRRMRSRVLAGTSAPGEGSELLRSPKDRSEHQFAVESVAQALSPLAEQLDVPTEPHLLDLPNVTHLATEVTARLAQGNVLDAIAALHPTAAVCGTPTTVAFDLLETIEGTERGRYSGPVGWIDAAGDGEFGIALRCGQLAGDRREMRVFAGGGIMPDSIAEVELAETRAKMRPVLEALGITD